MSKLNVMPTTLDNPNWLRAEYESGRTAQNIADELGVCRATVQNRLAKFGIPRRPRGSPPGVPKSMEHRAKMSAARTKYWQEHPDREAFRQKISATKLNGRPKPRFPRRYAATGDERGKILEHRLVVEQHLGRRLTEKEVVHHIDLDRGNNDIANLLLLPSTGEHTKLHHAIAKAKRNKKT